MVAHPEVAYGTSWQDSTAIIGKALGKDAEATKLVADTEATIKDKVAKYPQLAGKSFIYGNLEPAATEEINLYTANDNRPRFLSSIGMKLASVVEENSKGSKEFFIPWSAEKANELESDIFVTWVAGRSRQPMPSRQTRCSARSRPSRRAPSSRTRTIP